jgi:D-alanine-D-alanine ligase
VKVGLAVVMQRSDAPEEADFTTEAERDAMAAVLAELGHEVEPIEFGEPLDAVVRSFDRVRPDVVFNTVEQVRGEPRPAGLVPTICRTMGVACTGPGPRAITIGSDKWLTKRVVPAGPIAFAAPDLLVTRDHPWDANALDDAAPLIVKPNTGGSSQGISAGSIAHTPGDVPAILERLDGFLDAGVLVERFVPGRDVTVGCVLQDGAWRVLTPVEYATPASGGEHLLTEDLKRWAGWDQVVPRRAELTDDQLAALREHALATVRAVGANGVARVDYRVAHDDRIVALEINAIANVEAGAGLVLSAGYAGLAYTDLIALMVDTAIPG